MTKILVSISLLFLGFTAQSQASEEAAVRRSIDRFFEGMQARDTSAIREVIGQDVVLQTTGMNREGQPVLRNETLSGFMQSLVTIPDSLLLDERLLDYNIRIDGQLAHAWTPYEFYINDNFSHCGVNSFHLFHDGTIWRIISIADTRRREGCQ